MKKKKNDVFKTRSESLFNKLFGLFFILSVINLTSCEKIELPTEQGETQKINIETRATANSELTFPVQIFAFKTSDGSLAGQQKIMSENEKVALDLPQGEYQLLALSGTNDYSFPENPNRQSEITIPKGYATHGLLRGVADVSVGEKQGNVHITLSPAVTNMQLSLSNIPEEVTAMEVVVSPLHNALKMDGTYLNPDSKVTIEANKTNQTGVWSTTSAYLFGSNRSLTVLSIRMTTPDGQEIYSHTLNLSLENGTPYLINGNFSGGFSLGGDWDIENWKPSVSIDFDFPGNNSSGEGGDDPQEGEITVTEIPATCSAWNGHVVVLATNVTSNSADLLLISRKEWINVSSANGNNPTEAKDLAAEYSEDGLSEWRIPSKDEARLIADQYFMDDQLNDLNTILKQNGGDTIGDGDDNFLPSTNYRYLCENGIYSFVVGKSGTVSSAGSSRTYCLRLVKTIKVRLAE